MLRRLPVIQHVVNYLGVAIASKFVPVASIFIYSHAMSVTDYGVLNLSASYLWIFGIIMTLNLHTGIGRYVYAENSDMHRFLGTTLLAIGLVFVACTLVIVVWLDDFSRLLSLGPGVILLMLVVVLGSIAESIYTQLAIHGQTSSKLFKVMGAKALATLALSIALLFVVKEDKYLAVLYADSLVNGCLVAYVLLGLRGKVSWTFSVEDLKNMASYAVPLIPYMLSLTLLSQFDRVMIDRYFGKEQTGLYSLAYNVGILLLMLVTAVLNVFNPAFFESANKKDYARLERDSKAVFALAVLATAMLVLFGESVFAALVPAKYASALDLIPLVAIGGLCFVTFHIWVRVIAYANQTYLISLIAVAATVLKIGLNVVLLPIYGYKAAALTTVLAYLAMSLLCVAAVNVLVRLIDVRIVPDLIYVASLTAVMLFFRHAALPPIADVALRVAILAGLAWHLRARISGLVTSRRVAPAT